MAKTFTLIEATTIGSGGASSITFTSIPSTYTDLLLLHSTRGTSGGNTNVYIKFNNSTSNFTGVRLYGEASIVYFDTEGRWCGFSNGAINTSNSFSNTSVYIPNYTGSDYKSFSVDSVATTDGSGVITALGAQLWSNSAAINEITITPDNAYSQYSTAYLYGISNS